MSRGAISLSSPSLSTFYISMVNSETDTTLATGTAFLYEHRDLLYLVTAGHNLTGYNYETKTRLSKHAGIPDKIVARLRYEPESSPNNLGSVDFEIGLYDDDDLKKPIWLIPQKKNII